VPFRSPACLARRPAGAGHDLRDAAAGHRRRVRRPAPAAAGDCGHRRRHRLRGAFPAHHAGTLFQTPGMGAVLGSSSSAGRILASRSFRRRPRQSRRAASCKSAPRPWSIATIRFCKVPARMADLCPTRLDGRLVSAGPARPSRLILFIRGPCCRIHGASGTGGSA